MLTCMHKYACDWCSMHTRNLPNMAALKLYSMFFDAHYAPNYAIIISSSLVDWALPHHCPLSMMRHNHRLDNDYEG